jgi:phosphatidylserine/phosphatidylglycerophosphate/cardiolipin synthase-like enzyme
MAGVPRRVLAVVISAAVFFLVPAPAAADRLCDPAFENCRVPLIDLIRNEQAGIDVAFWFMEDARYTYELIQRHKAGVPVRVLVDTRANSSYPNNALRLAELANAGIPMRRWVGAGILHFKMMAFAGQRTVEFSGANYSGSAFKYETPYTNYVDEAIFFTLDPVIVNSFLRKFDDHWVNTSLTVAYANVSGAPVRSHPLFAVDPAMNFVPGQDFGARSVSHHDAETQQIDAIIYRITDRRHTDALIAARSRGVRVRVITEPKQYRDPARLWHSWNVDRMYMAGIELRHRAHAGLLHQKSTLLYGQDLVIFGSSNWTGPSAKEQAEHNYFARLPWFFEWFRAQFERKWWNSTGAAETTAFLPLPPDKPGYAGPSNASLQSTSVTLSWKTGPWAHKADVYFGTSATPPLVSANRTVSPNGTATYAVSGLTSGVTYYWKVVSKTMANKTATGSTWSFTVR